MARRAVNLHGLSFTSLRPPPSACCADDQGPGAMQGGDTPQRTTRYRSVPGEIASSKTGSERARVALFIAIRLAPLDGLDFRPRQRLWKKEKQWCRRGESNPHALAGTRP